MPLNTATALLILSTLLFGAFFLNVLSGASDLPLFLSDTAELLLLFVSCIIFVASTLQMEKNKRKKPQQDGAQEEI